MVLRSRWPWPPYTTLTSMIFAATKNEKSISWATFGSYPLAHVVSRMSFGPGGGGHSVVLKQGRSHFVKRKSRCRWSGEAIDFAIRR